MKNRHNDQSRRQQAGRCARTLCCLKEVIETRYFKVFWHVKQFTAANCLCLAMQAPARNVKSIHGDFCSHCSFECCGLNGVTDLERFD